MSESSRRSLRYGDELISFTVRQNPARTSRRIAIHIEPGGRVQVDAPCGASNAEVQAALSLRAGWISRHLATIRQRSEHASPLETLSGQSLLYLGRRHVLRVVVDAGQRGSVRLRGACIDVAVSRGDAAEVRTALDRWYLARAREVLAARLEHVAARLPWVRALPPMQLRSMKRRWGSCSPAGRITLNPLLVRAPGECIDYVLIHELCHLRHHHHGPAFYRALDAQLPGWPAIKQRLDGLAEQILGPISP